MQGAWVALIAGLAVSAGGALAADQKAATQSDAAAPRSEEPAIMPLSLPQALELAKSTSFRVGRARRNEATAKLLVDSARAGYMPRIDSNLMASQGARGSYARSDSFTYERFEPNFDGGVSAYASLPLDISGTIKRQVQNAQLSLDMIKNSSRQTEASVNLEIKIAYLTALQAQSATEIATRYLKSVEALMAAARTRAPSVAPFLQVELQTAEQTLASELTNSDIAQDNLKQALRLPTTIKIELTSPITQKIATPERASLLEAALGSRSEIKDAKLRIEQAEVSVKQADDWTAPRLSVSGYYNEFWTGETAAHPDDVHDRFYGASLRLTVPVFNWDGGLTDATRRMATLQVEQARADVEEAQERVALEVRQAQIALDRAEQRLKSVPDAASALEALKRAEQALLAAGSDRASSLLAQVSNARNLWRSAEQARIDAYADYNTAVCRMIYAAGVD